MPLYEYVCLDCKIRFDVLRPIKDADAPISCESCQSEHTSRAISVFFAHSDGRTVTQSAPGCSACSSRACSTCGR